MKSVLNHLSGVSLILASLIIGGFAYYAYEATWTYEQVQREEEAFNIAVHNAKVLNRLKAFHLSNRNPGE